MSRKEEDNKRKRMRKRMRTRRWMRRTPATAAEQNTAPLHKSLTLRHSCKPQYKPHTDTAIKRQTHRYADTQRHRHTYIQIQADTHRHRDTEDKHSEVYPYRKAFGRDTEVYSGI